MPVSIYCGHVTAWASPDELESTSAGGSKGYKTRRKHELHCSAQTGGPHLSTCTLRTYGATLTHLKRVKDKLKPEYKYLMNLRLKAISPAVPGQRVNTPSYMDDLICVTHILNRCSAPFLLALRLIQLLQQTSSAPLESASPPVQSCKAMMRQLGICQTLLWSVLQRT